MASERPAPGLLLSASAREFRPGGGSGTRTHPGRKSDLENKLQECFSCFPSFLRRVRRGFVSIHARDLGRMSDKMFGSERRDRHTQGKNPKRNQLFHFVSF